MNNKNPMEKMFKTVQMVQDSVLGIAIINAMREKDPEELESLRAYFMQREWFIEQMDSVMTAYMQPETQSWAESFRKGGANE